MNPSGTESAIQSLVPTTNLQLLTKKRIRILVKLNNLVETTISPIPGHIYDSIKEMFKSYEADFDNLQESIEEFATLHKLTDPDFEKANVHFSNLQRQFINKSQTVPDKVDSLPTNVVKSNISLPRLSLPTFTGSVSEWSNFQGMYCALVHDNSSLSQIEKFHYLKSCLKDSAASMISHLPVNEENYNIAFNHLKERFSDKRRLCAFYIDEILDFKSMNNSSYQSLRTFLDINSNYIAALKAQNLPDLSEFIILSICLKKLDNKTRFDFENTVKSGVIPSCQDLMSFITDRIRKSELVHSNPSVATSSMTKPKQFKSLGSLVTSNETKNVVSSSSSSSSLNKSLPSMKCFICNLDGHNIYSCTLFSQLSVEQKYDKLKEKQLCFQCLGNHHKRVCKSIKTCKICNSSRHHSLLHLDKAKIVKQSQTSNVPQSVETSELSPSCNSSSVIQTKDLSTCLLGTANVIVFDCYNRPQLVRAIIDSASQITAITSNLLERLHLKTQNSGKSLVGIGSKTTVSKGETNIVISSPIQNHLRLHTKAVVLPSITCNQPTSNLNQSDFRRFHHLELADKDFHISRPVDLLIGAELFLQTLSNKANTHIVGQPGALLTKFGWIIMGKLFNSTYNHTESAASSSLIIHVDPIHQTLQKFWEIEEVQPTRSCEDPVKTFCENLFVETTKRNTCGRYQVALPFKSQPVKLGDNRSSTLKKFLSLEKRLSLNSDMRIQYHDFMRQYIELGHMSIALKSSTYVIPHHCVLKPTSSTTRLRVVFNASAPCSDGAVLNEALHSGPNLQNELVPVLLKFRTHNVVVTSDIKMMYRQIEVREEDRQHQHIFYRSSPDQNVDEYELHTVTYGMVSSSYLSQRTMLQLVNDHGEDFPLAANAVRSDTYVDDIVTGANNLQEARLLIQQLNDLMAKGGLELRKWASNVPEAIADFPDDFLENPRVFSDSSQSIKVLGFQWNPSSDTFSYNVIPFSENPTKRSILSYTSKLYDPIGLLSPVLFLFKYFLKLLWLSNLDWDDPLDEDLTHQWTCISSSIMSLANVQIPRCIDITHVNVSIIGFCDASEKGYGACIYIHISSNCQFMSMNLVLSKTRVAPVKTLTIPRLELCAALLLSKMYKIVLPLFEKCISNVRLYSDAKLVLNWLKTPTYKLKTYVSNRVSQILDLTAPECWFHVPTESNPADLASRGLAAKDIVENSLWWHGHPSFHVVCDEFPISKVDKIEDKSELKPQISILTTTVVEKSTFLKCFENYSNIHKATRVFAFVLRFLKNCKIKKAHSYNLRSRRAQQVSVAAPPPLSVAECRSALMFIVKLTQQFYFSDALKLLTKEENPPQGLRSLSPFLDPSGLLRVGGRLRNSCLPYDSRHPLLLPKKSHLSTLICDQMHSDNLHVGPRTTQSLVNKKYWIISARSLIKSRIHNCVRCIRMRAQPPQPIMSELPNFRVTTSDVFTHVGIDFAGPFSTKCSPLKKPRIYKGYLALFICLAVKAVHLEYVSELTTEAFLAAFDRFVSRRGLPAHMYSDNGLNFVGAAKHLSDLSKFLSDNSDEILNALVKREVTWHFNPPNAPNFGGIWEANIKSAKSLLKAQIGDASLTMEEYFTVFSRIEAIMNSRPLLDLSPDPNESMPLLTPGHFLIGRPLLQSMEVPLDNSTSTRQRWTYLRQLVQSFWHRWSSEYLHTLTQRSKWQVSSSPVQVGQVVIIKKLNTSPSNWPLGKIETLHPGRDNVNRVATVRTAAGLIVRPINKLIVLPVA